MSHKIELVTQPAKDTTNSVREEVLRKLLELVENKTDQNDTKSDDVEVDEDGFEIPQDRIPIDGHFSTEEVKELVKLTQEEGMLLDEVIVKVLDSNEVGDRIEIVGEDREEEMREDVEKDQGKECK